MQPLEEEDTQGPSWVSKFARNILTLEFDSSLKVWAIDRDPEAIARASWLNQNYPERFVMQHASFEEIGRLFSPPSVSFDAAIFDLGVSSDQVYTTATSNVRF